jgi:hypothetical protein
VSTVPGEFTRETAKRGEPRVPQTPQRSVPEDDGATFWQWLAIGVLIGCWLAEATWCIDRGF